MIDLTREEWAMITGVLMFVGVRATPEKAARYAALADKIVAEFDGPESSDSGSEQ